MSPLLSLAAFLAIALESPVPPPATPGLADTPPEHSTAAGAPLVYSFTEEAGPDQSFLLVGEGLTDQVEAWGTHPEDAGGRAIMPKVQSCDGQLLLATRHGCLERDLELVSQVGAPCRAAFRLA